METELMALATAGASALVQQMVSETWEQSRSRLAGFFARRAGADREAVGEELESVRTELLAAGASGDEEARREALAEARTEWRARMRRELRATPDAADELRALLATLPSEAAGTKPSAVHNTINGGVQHGPVIQTGSIGSLNLGGTRG
ncbi:hypothetical protein [Streptomyces sp. SP18CS02]|uniref:hypothetical protein n=1 Tax=Streptomyces sp. SP18CS02 TaxID=3002531 RepID=UPI002E784178|nr:hypothetical protein [Streptomyces sp. SP18CS02]MEE1754956.1 hypothetical protein [Streptomyces sp. SP18CS02]